MGPGQMNQCLLRLSHQLLRCALSRQRVKAPLLTDGSFKAKRQDDRWSPQSHRGGEVDQVYWNLSARVIGLLSFFFFLLLFVRTDEWGSFSFIFGDETQLRRARTESPLRLQRNGSAAACI